MLSEDAGFPATKDELLLDHRWRVIDASEDRRVHAAELLEALPAGRYRNAREVGKALRGPF